MSKHGGRCECCGYKRMLEMVENYETRDYVYLCSFCKKHCKRLIYQQRITMAEAMEKVRQSELAEFRNLDA